MFLLISVPSKNNFLSCPAKFSIVLFFIATNFLSPTANKFSLIVSNLRLRYQYVALLLASKFLLPLTSSFPLLIDFTMFIKLFSTRENWFLTIKRDQPSSTTINHPQLLRKFFITNNYSLTSRFPSYCYIFLLFNYNLQWLLK